MPRLGLFFVVGMKNNKIYVICIILNMEESPRKLTEREETVLLPAIKAKLSGAKTDDEIVKALNDYMETAQDAPSEHANKTDEEIVKEVIQRSLSGGGRRTKSSKKRATRRRRSSKRKSRKMNKRRK